MKILVIIPSLHRGGAERVVSNLTQEWAKHHAVTLVVFDATSPAYPHGGKQVDLGLAAHSGIARKLLNAFARVFRLARVIRQVQPDRIISFMESANFPAILAALAVGRLDRLIVSVRNDPARFPGFYRVLIPLFYRLPVRVVAVSAGIGKALVGMGLPAFMVRTIPNPIASAAPDDHQSEPLALPIQRFILGVGRLHPQKGFDRLLKAFATLEMQDLKLVILGEGSERSALEQLTDELGIRDRVLMPGNVADPMPWYRQAACFVLSSRHEGWPNVLMEAMSNGCPVVSFDCNYGPNEIIENGVSGLLVKDGDVARLMVTISCLLTDNELRLRISEAGKRRMKNFTVEKIAPQWHERERV